MRNFIEKTQLMNTVNAPLNVCPDLVMNNIVELACNLQQLVQLGFDYEQIDMLLLMLLDNDKQFKNNIISTILSRK
jgi:hypothetical protein